MAEPMIYRIEKIDEGERGGQEGIYVTLFNVSTDQERQYPDFISEWHDKKGATEAIQEAGEGALVKIKWKKNGKWQNIDEVYPADEAASEQPSDKGGSSKSTGSKASSGKPGSTGKKASTGDYRKPDELIRIDALRQGVNLIGLLSAAGSIPKKLIASGEAAAQLAMQMSSKFEAFIKGEETGKVESDDSDLNKEGVDADDDIPF